MQVPLEFEKFIIWDHGCLAPFPGTIEIWMREAHPWIFVYFVRDLKRIVGWCPDHEISRIEGIFLHDLSIVLFRNRVDEVRLAIFGDLNDDLVCQYPWVFRLRDRKEQAGIGNVGRQVLIARRAAH